MGADVPLLNAAVLGSPWPAPSPLAESLGPWSIPLAGFFALAAVFSVVFMLVRRVTLRRESTGSRVIAPQSVPPQNLNLLECAALAKLPVNAVAAQVVSFAVRGNIRILGYPIKVGDNRSTAQFLTSTAVDDQELELLKALFGYDLTAGATRGFGAPNGELARAIKGIQQVVPDRLLARTFTARRVTAWAGVASQLVMAAVFLASLAVAVISIAVGIFTPLIIVPLVIITVQALISAAIKQIAQLWDITRPPVLTDLGADLRDYLIGTRDYLQPDATQPDATQPDATQPDATQPDDGMLPFAVLWGLEADWLNARYALTPPRWYIPNGPFDASGFNQAIGRVVAAIGASTA